MQILVHITSSILPSKNKIKATLPLLNHVVLGSGSAHELLLHHSFILSEPK